MEEVRFDNKLYRRMLNELVNNTVSHRYRTAVILAESLHLRGMFDKEKALKIKKTSPETKGEFRSFSDHLFSSTIDPSAIPQNFSLQPIRFYKLQIMFKLNY